MSVQIQRFDPRTTVWSDCKTVPSGPAAADWIAMQDNPQEFRVVDDAQPPKETQMAKRKKPEEETGEADREPKPREEQGQLMDTEHPEDKPLIAAARKYVGFRDERQELNRHESKAKDKLIAFMEERGLTNYVHDGVQITIEREEEPAVTVKVKIKEPAPAAEK